MFEFKKIGQRFFAVWKDGVKVGLIQRDVGAYVVLEIRGKAGYHIATLNGVSLAQAQEFCKGRFK